MGLAARERWFGREAPGHAHTVDAAPIDIDNVFGAGVDDDMLVVAIVPELVD